MVFPPDTWADPAKIRLLISAMLDGYNSQVEQIDCTRIDCLLAALNVAKIVTLAIQENSGTPERFWLDTATATFIEMMRLSTFQTGDPEALSALRAGAEEFWRPESE